MDNFKEEVVTRKQGVAVSALGYIMCWILIVGFGFFGMLGLSSIMGMRFDVINFILAIVGGGVAFLLFRYKDNFRTEYEYTFTNGEMDFAIVLGNNRRKHLSSLRVRDMEAGGWVDSDSFEKYETMQGVKRLDYFLNSKSKLYFLFYVREGKKYLLLCEPSQEMVGMMTQYAKVLEK